LYMKAKEYQMYKLQFMDTFWDYLEVSQPF